MREKIRRNRRERGQGMTEYIIIVAVVAVLSIAVITQFGNQVRNLIFNSGQAISGSEDRHAFEASDENVHRDLGDLEGGSES